MYILSDSGLNFDQSDTILSQLQKIYGKEQQYKKLACAIVEARYTFRRFERTSELVH